jgi:hypothetical protein
MSQSTDYHHFYRAAGANTSAYNTPANAYGTTGLADTGIGTATYGNTDISGYRSANTDTYGGHRTNTGAAYDDTARSSRYDEIIEGAVNAANTNTTRKTDRDTGTGYGQGLRNTYDVGPGRNVEKTDYGSRTDFRR